MFHSGICWQLAISDNWYALNLGVKAFLHANGITHLVLILKKDLA